MSSLLVMAKKIKRILLWFAAAIFLLLAVGITLGFLYEDEVKQQIVHEVNHGLNTEISVDEISFTVLKKFPNAALHFHNLMALDAIETTAPKDTLLYAQDLFLEFNLLDIFTRNYTIRKVEVSHAVLRLKVDDSGKDNFHFWKAASDTSTAKVAFKLAEVGFRHVDFSYRNVQNGFHLNTQIDRLNLSGNFQEAVFDLDASSRLLVQTLQIGDTEYLRNQYTELAVITRIDTRNKRYEVEDGAVDFDGMEFRLSGYFQEGEDQYLVLDLNGDRLDIPEILSFIPKKFTTRFDGYDPRGLMTFGLHLEGNPSATQQTMALTAEFNVANAGVKHLKSGLSFKDFSATGRFQNNGNQPDHIELDQFRFKLKDGFIAGNGSITDFSRPLIHFELKGEAQLSDLQEILEIKTIENISGGITLECRFSGVVSNPDALSVKDLQKAEISGKLAFSNTTFKIRNHDQKYHQISGAFHLNGNDAAVKKLRGNIHTSDIALDGVFINFVPFVLIENERMTIQASLHSNYINLAELLATDAAAPRDSSFNFQLPPYVDINVNSSIDQLVFRTFTATDINGQVRINQSGITAQPLTFHTSQGQFQSEMTVKPSGPQQFMIESNTKISHIDIQQLFTEFGNFGQDFITDNHLRGTANADVVFRTQINNELKIAEKSIYSLIDIDITNGQLIGLNSLAEIADYIRQNKLLNPLVKTNELKSKLQHVEFARLNNQIEIKNGQVLIPEMQLESSAMNLTVSGNHAFNSIVDYRIRFRLTELLTNPTHTEFGDIKDDGSGGSFFLRMNGPLNNLSFTYDRNAAREQRRNYFQQEKETLKDLIRDEFGFGKNKNESRKAPASPEPKKTDEPVIEVTTPSDESDKKKEKNFWDALEDDDDF